MGKPNKDGNFVIGHHFGVFVHDKTRQVTVFAGR